MHKYVRAIAQLVTSASSLQDSTRIKYPSKPLRWEIILMHIQLDRDHHQPLPALFYLDEDPIKKLDPSG